MKLLAIDSNSILNRAYYGVKALTTKDGLFTNGIYGFLNIFLKLLHDSKPDRVAMAFDLPAPTFRHQMYDGYKAQRKGMPNELAMQLPYLKDLIRALGYAIVEQEGFEADDILGTLSRQCAENGDTCIIATGDRDSFQLINDQVTVMLATTKVGKAEYIPHTPETIREKYGVTPLEMIEVKALMGDSSDNIPGVAGIGEKTALALIAEHHSIDQIYQNIENITLRPAIRAKLEAGKDMAYLSHRLAKINTQVPLTETLESYCPHPVNHPAAAAILQKLEMYSMIDKLQIQTDGGQLPLPPQPEREPLPALALQKSPSDQQLQQALDSLAVLDLSCRYEGDRLAEAAFVEGESVWLVTDPGQIRLILEKRLPIRTHNCKQLYRFAMSNQISLGKIQFDTMLAAYLLSPNSAEYRQERLAGEYQIALRQIQTQTEMEEGEAETVRFAAALDPLCQALEQRIQKNQQDSLLHEIEIPLSEVLASMELLGFEVDTEGLAAFGQQLDVSLEKIQGEIHEQAGYSFNINSPKQLGEVLFIKLGLPTGKKTKSGFSTNADVLESLRMAHPIVENILEYRKLAKLKSTYVEGLLKVVGEDGRIHSSFNQTETRTGRISSAEPNLQNIPVRTELGSNLRKFFRAKKGCQLVDADYSQIELRVLAAVSDDTNMIEAFLSGEDIHTNTAAQVFDMPPLFVTPLMRSRAKAVNFGIVYGIGAFSLSQDIGVSVGEADMYIKNYLKTYSGVKRYMDKTKKMAAEQGYVTTLFQRRRYLPELAASNHNTRAFGERVAMNTPIQGTAADIIKIAMIRVYKRLQEEQMSSRLILQVHDELLLEVPPEELEKAKTLVKEEMERAAALKVPLVAEVNTGSTWYESK